MTRVLVTGGAGFIGSHLTDRLVADGHRVTVLDNLSTGKRANLDQVREDCELVELDITSPDVESVFGRVRPEVVFHLAAQIDVRRSVADPIHDATVNILGTIRLLEAARRTGTQKFISTTSGGTIYGEPPLADLPIDEEYGGHPASPYGASKRSSEEYLHTYAALYGLRWTDLALGNIFGPRQDPTGEAGVVSIFGGRMIADRPLVIFGDGEQTRDYVFVLDVVDAYLRCLEAGDNRRFNIGTAERTSVNALFAALADLTGYTREPEYAPPRTGELDHIALDWARAAAELGWKPRVTLRDGLAQTVEWLRSS
jgi:UDP-glucose 4-epimerase